MKQRESEEDKILRAWDEQRKTIMSALTQMGSIPLGNETKNPLAEEVASAIVQWLRDQDVTIVAESSRGGRYVKSEEEVWDIVCPGFTISVTPNTNKE